VGGGINFLPEKTFGGVFLLVGGEPLIGKDSGLVLEKVTEEEKESCAKKLLVRFGVRRRRCMEERGIRDLISPKGSREGEKRRAIAPRFSASIPLREVSRWDFFGD